MKVALVIDDRIDRPGGVQEYVLGLYDFLKGKNQTPIIFTSGRYSQKQKKGRRIISFGKTLDLPGGDQKGIPLSFGQEEKIKKVLKREKPAIVHVQGIPGPLGLGFLKYSFGVNLMTFHAAHDGVWVDLLAKPLSSLWRRANENLQGRIAVSPLASYYAEKFFPGAYKIIPNGVDLYRFHQKAPQMAKFKDGKVNILFVGRLDKRKGVKFLLSTFKLVSERLPGVRLIIVGEGPEGNQAKRFARQNNLENVEFAGMVSGAKLPSYYATADIFCSPATHGESFGIVLLEAMATGLPVVAFDNPGYRAVFPKYASEFLVFNRSIPALAQALLVLAKNPQLRKRLGRKNHQYVKRFSWEKVGGKILKYYQNYGAFEGKE